MQRLEIFPSLNVADWGMQRAAVHLDVYPKPIKLLPSHKGDDTAWSTIVGSLLGCRTSENTNSDLKS